MPHNRPRPAAPCACYAAVADTIRHPGSMMATTPGGDFSFKTVLGPGPRTKQTAHHYELTHVVRCVIGS